MHDFIKILFDKKIINSPRPYYRTCRQLITIGSAIIDKQGFSYSVRYFIIINRTSIWSSPYSITDNTCKTDLLNESNKNEKTVPEIIYFNFFI
jgi:hypothetical protein